MIQTSWLNAVQIGKIRLTVNSKSSSVPDWVVGKPLFFINSSLEPILQSRVNSKLKLVCSFESLANTSGNCKYLSIDLSNDCS